MSYQLPPPPGQFVQTSGGQLHYVTSILPSPAAATATSTVVLIHGILASTTAWRGLQPLLVDAGHRVIAFDLPCHGYSSRSDAISMALIDQANAVAEALTQLNLGPVHLVGQSMGAGVALLIAALHPQLVRTLCVMDAVSYPFSIPIKARLGILPIVGASVVRWLYNRSLLKAFLKNDVYLNPAFATDELLDATYAHLDTPISRRAVHRAMLATHNPVWLSAYFEKIRCPTLILWGKQDKLIPPALGTRLQQDIAGAELHYFDHCGHEPMVEQPEQCASHLEAFWGKCARSSL